MSDERQLNSDASSCNQSSKIANRKHIEVSAGLVFRDDLLLITQRRAQDHLGGFWEFPGGKRNPNETDEDCLKRELAEELDIEVEVRELVDTVRFDYGEKLVQLKFFRCVWRAKEPRLLGCQDLAWVSREQLANYQFPAADAQLLNKLRVTPELWR